MKNAVFVDLSNFYSSCLKSKIATPELLRDYFINGLDFDRLTYYLTGEWAPTWVFYSKGKTGPSDYRIANAYQDSMIKRINLQKGVTARDVDIPGEQRETSTFKCSNCGAENSAETIGEKGVDASLTVHLFETMDTWDTAFLLSGDADFVPVVSSLRRMGKNIITVSSQNTSEALIRESYDFRNLDNGFFSEDLLEYRLFMKDGFIDQWLSLSEAEKTDKKLKESYFIFRMPNPDTHIPIEEVPTRMQIDPNGITTQSFRMFIGTRGLVDKDKWTEMITDFFDDTNLAENYLSNESFSLSFSTISILGIARRLHELSTRNKNLCHNNNRYFIRFQ